MEVEEYEEMVGERIQEWIDETFTFENGCKREATEEDNIESNFNLSWVFTDKGYRLYESYLNKASKLIQRKYPNADYYEDITKYTNVIEF